MLWGMIIVDPATTALISLMIAVITTSLAIYLVRTRPRKDIDVGFTELDELGRRIDNESAELWESWSSDQFLDFLSGFLLEHELQVVKAMAEFMIEDVRNKGTSIFNDCGWRNKHRIISATGVPQRAIYNRNGIIERLVSLDLAESRAASSGWGKQKLHYRLNPLNAFMGAFLEALRRSFE